jgi:hypothetical protein
VSYEDFLIRESVGDGTVDPGDVCMVCEKRRCVCTSDDAANQTFGLQIEVYWKSKQGKCLACGLDIAVQEQYCRLCTDFLVEVHAQHESHRI